MIATEWSTRRSVPFLSLVIMFVFPLTHAQAEPLKNFRVLIYTGDHEKRPGETVAFTLIVKDRIIASRSGWKESEFTNGTSRIKGLPANPSRTFESEKDCRDGVFTVQKTGTGRWIASFEVLASTLDNQPVQVLRETAPLEFSLDGNNKDVMTTETIDVVDKNSKTEKVTAVGHSYPLTCGGR